MTRAPVKAMCEISDSERFLAIISHELRTPTTAILGWAEMLRREGADGEVLAKCVEVISRNALLMARLIGQLTEFSRVRAGCADLEFQTVALVPALRAAVETMTPLAGAKSVSIAAELDPAADPVNGDPACLQQVFINLLSNAVKFSLEGGLVRVRLARRGDWAEVEVSDEGRGISPDFLPHVFDPFRQGSGGSLNAQGLGLGLAITREIVMRHGGGIHAVSGGEGRGATFTVRLRRTDEAPAA